MKAIDLTKETLPVRVRIRRGHKPEDFFLITERYATVTGGLHCVATGGTKSACWRDNGVYQGHAERGDLMRGSDIGYTRYAAFDIVEVLPSEAKLEEQQPVEDILADREKTHGSYEGFCKTFCQLIDVTNDALTRTLDGEYKVATTFILMKLSRIFNGDPNHADSWDDIAGYATLAARHARKVANNGK